MPLFVIPFPAIDPVAVALGPFAIRWYALAYIVGLIIGWRYCLMLADRPPNLVSRKDIDDFLVWATLGVVLGGRIGYVLFYNLPYYTEHPIQALYLWHGGMSFHGGALGVTLAIVLFARRRQLSILALGDIVIEAMPIGLFFGRIANFINGELYGRETDVPWAMVFPAAGRCRAIRASSTRPRARAFSCSSCCSSPSIAARGGGQDSKPEFSSPAMRSRACRASCSASPTCSSASWSSARPWGSCCRSRC